MLGVAGQPGGDRHRVGDHAEAQVAREQAGEPVVVEPASMSTVEPAGGSWSRAARAIRSFCSVLAESRSTSPDSIAVRLFGGTAPPCTRRTSPIRSRVERSRRTVSVVTSYSRGDDVHRHAPALGDELGHRLLALLGVHGHR